MRKDSTIFIRSKKHSKRSKVDEHYPQACNGISETTIIQIPFEVRYKWKCPKCGIPQTRFGEGPGDCPTCKFGVIPLNTYAHYYEKRNYTPTERKEMDRINRKACR